MKPFSVSGLLRAAASYIEIHGHEQRRSQSGGAGRKQGPCCPIVAVHRVGGDAWERNMLAILEPCAGKDGLAIWSDRTPTAEVLATMRRVARELDSKPGPQTK